MSEQAAAYDIPKILAALPHRYPMLLVDRVLECVPGQTIRALKNVTVNEPYFPGHFPHRPVMPGVLMLEALAQAAALLSWVFFIAPVMGVFTLGALGSLGAMILVAPLDLIGVLILIRIHTAMVRPANQKLVYAIPTWLLVVTGGAYVSGLFVLMIYALLTS